MVCLGLFLASVQPALGQQSAENSNSDRPSGPSAKDSLADEESPAIRSVPAYYVAPVKITGSIENELSARLTAVIEVHVNRDTGWYNVPLRLGQAVILDINYEGPREPRPNLGRGLENGQNWLFQGVGTHRLTLDMRVPLQSIAGSSKLELSVPKTAPSFPTQLKLTIPESSVQIDTGPDHQLTAEPQQDGSTLVSGLIRADRIALTWRSATGKAKLFTRVATAITLDRVEDVLRMRVQQTYFAEGSATEMTVKLPSQFSLSGLTPIQGRSYRSHELLEDNPGWVRVVVQPDERGKLELSWELEREFPLEGGIIQIDGFQVRETRQHDGTIGISELTGYTVAREITDDNVSVQRIGTQGVSPYPLRLIAAYRFVRQPLGLLLRIRKRIPSFTVRPRWTLDLKQEEALLDLDAHVSVQSGLVQTLKVAWPMNNAGDWTVHPHPDGKDLYELNIHAKQNGAPEIEIVLSEPREGDFSIPLRFSQPITENRFEFALPSLQADRTLSGWLLIRGAEDVEAVLSEDTLAQIEPLQDRDAEAWLFEHSETPSNEQSFRISNLEIPLSGNVSIRPREIQVASVVQLVENGNRSLQIVQRMDYVVRFGRILDLQFQFHPRHRNRIPYGAENTAVTCRLVGGGELNTNSEDGHLHVGLPSAMRGEFSVELIYGVETEAPKSSIWVPILESRDAQASSTTVMFPENWPYQVIPNRTDWESVPTAFGSVWYASGAMNEFSARLVMDVESAQQHYKIPVALARLYRAQDGQMAVSIRYRVESPPGRFVVGVPPRAQAVRVFWNTSPMEQFTAIKQPNEQRLEFSLPSENTSNKGWLHLWYTLDSKDNVVWSGGDSPLPVLPDEIWIDRVYVEIALPPGDHLFTYPKSMLPLFAWQPGIIWQRNTSESYLQLREKLLSSAGELELPVEYLAMEPASAMHVYPFQSFGTPRSLSFSVISLWMLILLGGGTTLGLSFLLWTVPQARHVLTVLLVCFLVIVAGFFAPESAEILVQPAMLGLFTAAVVIFSQSRNPRYRARRNYPLTTRSSAPFSESSERILGDEEQLLMASTQVRSLVQSDSGSQ